MRKPLFRIAVAVLALSALVGGGLYCLHMHKDRSPGQRVHARLTPARPKSSKTGRQKVGELLAGKVKAPTPERRRASFRSSQGRPMPDSDRMFSWMKSASRKDALAIQSALDDKDFDGVRALVDKTLKADDPDLRAHMVDALSWFGAAALPELTAFLADADPEVSEAAADAWQVALSDVEDDALKVETAQAAMTMLTNSDTLTMLMAEIAGNGDDLVTMQSIVDTIHDGTEEAVKVAMESYEDLTGEKWRDANAAEAWLQANYDPPEADDDEAK